VKPAWQLDASPVELVLGPPLLREHTDAILTELGYDADRIAELRTAAVVR
jgi:crotonobetainyl-CoA:carnitine CoA-transferase CaiB-like acyl-CoA transferase